MKIESIGSHYTIIRYIPIQRDQGVYDAVIFEIYATGNMDVPFDSIEVSNEINAWLLIVLFVGSKVT